MALKLFEFVEQFMMDTFLINITHYEKTGSTNKSFISLGNLNLCFFESESEVFLLKLFYSREIVAQQV